jgi:iron complex outermembrane receptor protein
VALTAAVLFFAAALSAQTALSTLEGVIVDTQGKALLHAVVTVKNGGSVVKTARTDASGHYAIADLAAGNYTVEASATGFETKYKTGIALTAGQPQQVSLTLSVSTVMDEVTVNASIDSIAAETAPSGGFLEERSAQSMVSNTYVENFTSPIADFGEIVQIVPGAFTTSSNGVGLGQSKTYFRGFPDGDYDIDFDGIPFYDTNTPTHHSWAFFPSQWIGGVDFDRSPGSASTIGPTPFGGSIHLLSKPLTSEMDLRGTFSYGTWNTKLYDAAYNSGAFGIFGSAPKSNLFIDWHRMTSDGYQTYNFNMRNAGSLLYQYQFSPKTVLTGFSGVIRLNSNGPNISSTRCMLYGVSATNAYSCAAPTVTVSGVAVPVTANGLQPYTGAGIKFLLTNNSDPTSWFDYQYNTYQVPTDFEYVSLKTEFGKGWYMEVKPYTYNYDNSELYSNATPITEVTAANANPTTVPNSILVGGKDYYDGVAIAPCNVGVVKKGITALPCGIEKYNSYRKYGETLLVTQTSKLGVFRTGLWYDWAKTNRHQYPSDPLNNWQDQPLPKFKETFWNDTYQPYAEYEWHASDKLNVTAGVKFSYFDLDVLHYADDGGTNSSYAGTLTCTSLTAACSATVEDKGSFTAWLPSLDFNYRLQPNWSVYAQAATGTIVPPSAVYDYNHTASLGVVSTTGVVKPKQQNSTTYQIGSVYKGQRITLDANAFHIRFQNTYASAVDVSGDAANGDTVYALQPSSITQGVEFESNMVLTSGLNLYLNATAGNAYYQGKLNAGTQTAPFYQKAPTGLWVAQTPSDTELEGLTYQKHGFDLGIFNKRIGEERVDSASYTNVEGQSIIFHNQAIINPFSTLDGYINYTVRNHSIFDQTKIRLSGTNLLDSHNMQNLSLASSPVTSTIPGTSYTDQFNATTAISGADTPGLMAGRSFSVSVTFGIAPRTHK